MAETIKIGGELESMATGGVVAAASAIKDKVKNKYQSEINNDVARHENEIHGTGGIDSRLSDVEQMEQIVIDGGEAQIATGTDFTNPDATKRAKVATVGAIVDGLNDGVYDVSKRNPTAGPNSDGKFTLDYILDNANTLIPTGWRHGGMTISFVQSSDNKYVQARCMAQNFTTDVTQWQGVDDEPVNGSKNLVESGAVFPIEQNINAICDYENKVDTDSLTLQEGSVNGASPSTWNKDGFNRYHKVITLSSNIRKIEIKANSNVSARVIFADTYNVVAGGVVSSLPNNTSISINANEKKTLDVPEGANYFIFNVHNNGADQTPEYIVLIDEDKDYILKNDGITKHVTFPIVGQINASGTIERSVTTYRVTEFVKIPKGCSALCAGIGSTNALLFGVYSSMNTSSFISAESKYFKGTTFLTTEIYTNNSNEDRYILISTRLDSISNSYYVVDNTSVITQLYNMIIAADSRIALISTTLEGTVGSDITNYLDSDAISKLPNHNGTLRTTNPCTWNLDGYIRYHKVIEIPDGATHLTIKANNTNFSGFILLNSYTEPTSDNQSMDCADGFEKAVWIPAGIKQEFEIPVGAKYIVFNEQVISNYYTPEYIIFRHAYARKNIDLSSYENLEGALNAASPAGWTVDAFNRYHKAISIPAWVKRIGIKANSTVNSRFILLDSYTEPTTNGEPVANTSWGYSDSVSIPAGETLILEKPNNATYLVVNVQSNQSGIMTPDVVVFDEQDNDIDTQLHKISVVTCNPGDYVGTGYSRGSSELLRQYRLAISEGSPDLLCVQADTAYVNDENTLTDREAIFDNYKFYKAINSGQYNNMRIMSNFMVKNERRVNYTGITGISYHPFFYVAELLLNNRIVGVATVHFDWTDVTVRRQQIAQVIEYMSAYNSIIVAGDMNPSDRVNGEHPDPTNIKCLWEEDNAIWSAAGYSIANGGRLGVYTTNLEEAPAGQTYPDPMPYDNIYVKGGYIMESKRLLADYMNDHAYIQADVVI